MREEDVIGSRIKVADSFFRRFLGLMGKKNLNPGEGLLLRRCRQIHTFFMLISIDVVFLDKKGEVIELIPQMPPGKISPYIKQAFQVLEMPPGTIEKHALQKKVLLKVMVPQSTY